MQEIEFRGFDLDLKKWIYGGYHKHIKRQVSPIGDELKENDIQHLIIISGFADWNMPRPLQVATNIDPKSIGQYTGLKDKNGVKIYDGDVVKLPAYLTYNTEYAICKWLDNRFSVEDVIGFGFVDLKGKKVRSDEWEDFEVIGNTYQNPELLEK